MHESNADIIFLQETHSSKAIEKIWRNEWGARVIFDHGTSNSKGVAILINKALDVKIIQSTRSGQGRYIITKILWDEKEILLVNIYAPNEDSPDFFLQIINQIQIQKCDLKIVGGDLNVHLQPERDTKGYKNLSTSAAAGIINEFMEEHSWLDIWRQLFPDSRQFTWSSRRPLKMSQLDYFLIPSFMIGYVDTCKIKPGVLSDHSIVELYLTFEDNLKGRGYWKLNTSLLTDKLYVDTINEVIDYADFRYSDLDPGIKWEMIKQDIWEASISFSCFRASEKKQRKLLLCKRLQQLEKKLAHINLKSSNSVKFIEKLNPKLDEVKRELNKMRADEIQGVIIRSKIRYYEDGGKKY